MHGQSGVALMAGFLPKSSVRMSEHKVIAWPAVDAKASGSKRLRRCIDFQSVVSVTAARLPVTESDLVQIQDLTPIYETEEVNIRCRLSAI